MAFRLRSAIGSDLGRRRTSNEDSGAAGDRLLVVADGMGGHAHGELASALAVSALVDLDERLPPDLDSVDLHIELAAAVDDAGTRLAEHAQKEPETQGMGTTVAGLFLEGDRLALVHVGDSRIYRLRAGELEQLTHDHTMVQQLVDDGQITPEEALIHPRRSVLMRALSTDHLAEPDLDYLDLQPGDRYLLCSDGVTAVLFDTVVREVLVGVPEAQAAVDKLIELANEAGGPDNITCIVADVIEVDDAAAAEPAGTRLVGAVADALRS